MMRNALALSALLLGLAACAPIGTPGGSSYYECSQGTRLRVDYRDKGAVVRINERQMIVLKSTPSTGGAVYEGRKGERLQRRGDGVVWNTALRTAPEQCRQVMIPR